MDKIQADSLTEVFRRSLAVYELLLSQREEGGEIIIRRDGVDRVVILESDSP